MWRPECHGSLPNGDPGRVTAAGYQCSSIDGGGVHTNSGVPNHGFALLVDGGTYNGQTITGIGLTKAAHIYWQAQRNYQGPTTDFADHADALAASCTDLIGAPLYELKTMATGWGATTPAITPTDCAQVDKVALAVQFRTAPNCTFTPMFNPNTPALCTTAGESPQNWLFQDFEAGMPGWTTQQTPVHPSTWADRPWTVVTGAPDGRPGSVVFGPDPVVGDCSNDLENGVTSLLSPVISIPANATAPVRMAWDHFVSMELDYDGGNLKASVNGGAFTLVPASAFTFNEYNKNLATSNNDNPMAGQAAWTGGDGGAVSSQWGQSQIDLSQDRRGSRRYGTVRGISAQTAVMGGTVGTWMMCASTRARRVPRPARWRVWASARRTRQPSGSSGPRSAARRSTRSGPRSTNPTSTRPVRRAPTPRPMPAPPRPR